MENSEDVKVTNEIPENKTNIDLNSKGLPKRKAASKASAHLKEISKFCKIHSSNSNQIYHKHGFVPLDEDEDTLLEFTLPISTFENRDVLPRVDSENSLDSISHSTTSSPPFPSAPPPSPSTPQSPTNNPLNPSFLSDALQTVVRDMKVFNEGHPLPPPDPRRSSRIKLQPISYSHLHKHGRCKERGRK